MGIKTTTKPESWMAFELNVLRRLKFKSISLPNASSPMLGSYLKNWDVKVLANSIFHSSYLELVAAIENDDVLLSDDEVQVVLEDAYVPQFELKNPALKTWFGETDSWWFDNVRTNIEKLESPISRAVATSLGLMVGDYALSFDEETRRLKQPFSSAFKRFRGIFASPIQNSHPNVCQNRSTKEFTAENYPDLMFLRLPEPRSIPLKNFLGRDAWKEEWVVGSTNIWDKLEQKLTGQLGAHVEAKTQYLTLLEDLFETASHINQWVVMHNENNFVSTQDVVESIGKIRRVDTIYTKDFSELTGTKAVK
jgi:hypothetical protein